MKKRIISMLLIMVMLLGLFPVTAQAEEPETAVDNSDITVSGENGFGTLLAEDIADRQEQMEAQETAGYSVTDLEITGNTATVTYASLETATLVVAIYTEDGMQLLTSGKAEVIPEETVAVVTIDGEMPQYFTASAYLLDCYDLSPLCTAYDTPLYTKEMQDLLTSTAEDYDQDRVLQLEESPETNFVVYAEGTKVIEPVEGANTVTTADDETNTYIIENADTQITSLQIGDVFAYAYGEADVLIVKVSAITVDGTTAIITGGDMETEEAFEFIKIEGIGKDEDAVYDGSTADEGVSYEEVVSEETGSVKARASEGGGSFSKSKRFPLEKTWKGEVDGISASCTIGGSLTFGADISVQYYLSGKTKWIEFKVELSANVTMTLDGTIDGRIKLGSLKYSIVPGIVNAGIEPAIILKFHGNISYTATLTAVIGIKYDSDSGVRDVSEKPRLDTELSAEFTLYFGFDLAPTVDIVDEHIAKLTVLAEVGVELVGVTTGTLFDEPEENAESHHTCSACIKMDLTGKIVLGGEIKFLNKDKLTVPIDIGKRTKPLGSLYYSIDHKEFGAGICPYRDFRVTIHVKSYQDDTSNPIGNASVILDSDEFLGSTNGHGALTTYLPSGSYELTVYAAGKEITKKVQISSADYILVGVNAEDMEDSDDTILEHITAEEYGIVDDGTVIGSGSCGSTVYWKLYSSGTLYISGFGKMNDYEFPGVNPPWYSQASSIKKVVIQEGINHIGNYAFKFCSNLTKVSIPESAYDIGEGAFAWCDSLNTVKLPEGLQQISDWMFYSSNLTHITIPETVTYIGEQSFEYCENLQEIIFPDGVTYIGFAAFEGCESLKTVTIPDGVENIEEHAFQDCRSLETVILGEGVKNIKYTAFYFCNAMTSIYIPKSVKTISYCAFKNCKKLTDVYFGGTNQDWSSISIGSENTYLTGANIHYESSAPRSLSLNGTVSSQMIESNAVFGGVYDTIESDSGIVKTASFADLVPGEKYVLLSLVSLDAQEALAGDNLLFIDQGIAGTDGTLNFQYMQRVGMDPSYVMLCGASTRNLENAEIIFPDMMSDGETQVVQPVVIYDGKTLVEGKDYVLVGVADYVQPGEYTCNIRGIRDYTGSVTCTYSVRSATIPTIVLNYPTVSFEDVIEMNVYYTATDIQDVVEMGLLTYTSKPTVASVETADHVVPGYDWSEGDQMYYSSTGGIAPKALGDTIYFGVYWKLKDGTYGYSRVIGYSLKTYAMNMLKTGTTEMKTLVAAMLNYGAAAQTYFGYNTDTPVNADMTDEQKALIADYSADMIDAVTQASGDKLGTLINDKTYSACYATVSFEGAFKINYYFKPTLSVEGDVTMYVWSLEDFNGVDVLSRENATKAISMTLTESGEHMATVDGIAAKDLDKAVYVSFVYSDGTTDHCGGVLGYTIGMYCKTQVAKTGTLSELAKACAVYGYYAKQLFN